MLYSIIAASIEKELEEACVFLEQPVPDDSAVKDVAPAISARETLVEKVKRLSYELKFSPGGYYHQHR